MADWFTRGKLLGNRITPSVEAEPRTMTIAQAITQGIEYPATGRLAEAEQIYRQILAVEADHPDALRLLGVMANGLGQKEMSVKSSMPSIPPNESSFIASRIPLGTTHTTIRPN